MDLMPFGQDSSEGGAARATDISTYPGAAGLGSDSWLGGAQLQRREEQQPAAGQLAAHNQPPALQQFSWPQPPLSLWPPSALQRPPMPPRLPGAAALGGPDYGAHVQPWAAPMFAPAVAPPPSAVGVDGRQLAATLAAHMAAHGIDPTTAASVAAKTAAELEGTAAPSAAAAGPVPGVPDRPGCGTSDGTGDGGGGAAAVGPRAIPQLKDFSSPSQLLAWANRKQFGGRSVVEMEDAGDTKWRTQQRCGNQLWRKVNLVLRRIAELKRQGSRTLSDFAAAQQADGEMEQLRMRVPGYVRHLEAAEAAKKKTAQPDGGKDGSSSD